jgi:hypothetical protein
MLASDAAHHPEASDLRSTLIDVFVKRGIGTAEQIAPAELRTPKLSGTDLRTLLESDWAAYEWVRTRREVLGIPKEVPFDVRRRLDVTKRVYHRGRKVEDARELVLKVAWEELEDNPSELTIAKRRSVTRGTTLAIRWAEDPEEHRVLANLTTTATGRDRAERDKLLLTLESDGVLRRAVGAAKNQLALGSTLYAEVADDVMTMKGGARLLHIVGGTDD